MATASVLLRTSTRQLLSIQSRRTVVLATRQCLAHDTTRCFSIARRALDKRYTEDHEWIELSSDESTGTTGTIGISEYAAKALGDVVYVELPETDLEVSGGDTIGAVESVKSASDIMTPITGKILEVNKVLEDTPSTINKSPEADGWLAKIQVGDAAEIEKLMDATAYKKFTEEAEEKH